MRLGRADLVGVAVGSAVSWAILAILILYVLPRDRVVIEVETELAAPQPTVVEERPRHLVRT